MKATIRPHAHKLRNGARLNHGAVSTSTMATRDNPFDVLEQLQARQVLTPEQAAVVATALHEAGFESPQVDAPASPALTHDAATTSSTGEGPARADAPVRND